jgi:hypothetical protein
MELTYTRFNACPNTFIWELVINNAMLMYVCVSEVRSFVCCYILIIFKVRFERQAKQSVTLNGF